MTSWVWLDLISLDNLVDDRQYNLSSSLLVFSRFDKLFTHRLAIVFIHLWVSPSNKPSWPQIWIASLSRYGSFGPLFVVPIYWESIYRSFVEDIWLAFNNKKNINSEFLIIRNLFGEIKNTTFSYLKFPNSIMNYSNNKANYWYVKKLKHMPSICHHPKSNFTIS